MPVLFGFSGANESACFRIVPTLGIASGNSHLRHLRQVQFCSTMGLASVPKIGAGRVRLRLRNLGGRVILLPVRNRQQDFVRLVHPASAFFLSDAWCLPHFDLKHYSPPHSSIEERFN
jgi:hypothetical protein